MSNSQKARLSAFLNLLGAFLVFLSFQASSTRLILVTSNDKNDKTAAFCIGDRAVFGLTPNGMGMQMGYACPRAENMKPAAVVNTESPWMVKLGWMVLAVGFALQLFSIEPSPLSKDDLKTLRKARKIMAE